MPGRKIIVLLFYSEVHFFDQEISYVANVLNMFVRFRILENTKNLFALLASLQGQGRFQTLCL